jgi:hypothetical protein
VFRIQAEGACACTANADGFTYFQVDPPSATDEVSKLTFQIRASQATAAALAGQKLSIWYADVSGSVHPQNCVASLIYVVGP